MVFREFLHNFVIVYNLRLAAQINLRGEAIPLALILKLGNEEILLQYI